MRGGRRLSGFPAWACRESLSCGCPLKKLPEEDAELWVSFEAFEEDVCVRVSLEDAP
jgi:hypothetical protein